MVHLHSAALAVLALAGGLAAQIPGAATYGTHAGDGWGRAVAVVGDVDADGVDDWAVGSPDADRFVTSPFPFLWTDVGRVVVYSGATGSSLWSWYGSTSGATGFGFAVCGAGDVDGDGHDDVLVGVPRADGAAIASGVVRLYSGATGALLRTIQGTQTNARFGHALDAGLDVDGDGRPDAIVGSPHENVDGSLGGPGQEGAVRIVSLTDGALLWIDDVGVTSQATSCPSLFCRDLLTLGEHGTAVALIGDRDGDGAVEIATGAPATDLAKQSKSSPFAPWVTTSSSDDVGLVRVREPFGDLHVRWYSSAAGRFRGRALAALGGLLPDNGLALAIGSAGGDGAVEIVSVHGTGGDDVVAFTEIVGTAGAPIGSVVASLGDVDGDGVVDVALGSPTADSGSPFAIQEAGEVYVHSALTGARLVTIGGDQGAAHLGSALAGGDVDGDGLPDIVTGAPDHDTSAVDTGAVFVFPGHGCVAKSALYGSGLAGTLGVPQIGAVGVPAIGGGLGLSIGNAAGAPTLAWIPLGLDDALTPWKGGTLLVAPFASFVVPLGVGTTTFTFTIPDDDALCGLSVYVQAIESDAGAVQGLAFTRGLRLDLGY